MGGEAKGNQLECASGLGWSCASTMDGFPGSSPISYLAVEPNWFATYSCGYMMLGYYNYVIVNHRERNPSEADR